MERPNVSIYRAKRGSGWYLLTPTEEVGPYEEIIAVREFLDKEGPATLVEARGRDGYYLVIIPFSGAPKVMGPYDQLEALGSR